jgi:hypothetical protein
MASANRPAALLDAHADRARACNDAPSSLRPGYDHAANLL